MTGTRQEDGIRLLGRSALGDKERAEFDTMRQGPVRILQIGEGNFLRGFVDWMIHEMRKQGKYDGAVAVSQPRPSGKPKLEQLRGQDGIYTLIVRGVENGKSVERTEKIAVFAETVDPYSEWDSFLSLADRPELEVVVSNTTEAGLAYQPSEYVPGEPILSYPGKLTALLHRRFETFGGDPQRGLVLLPCELLERNGDELRRCVLKHARDWNLPEAFAAWIRDHNRFLNSLVDRIVTGYPAEEAAGWRETLGYEDKLLNSAEPYYLWAIEGEAELERKLPFQSAGLSVEWTGDLLPYQLRKVRILNGAHTLMTPIALLHGVSEVREAMEHPVLGPFVRETIEREIIPAMPAAVSAEEANAYAASVFERFANPYIRHRLLDIAMNSVSKFRTRLLPSLEGYTLTHEGRLPSNIVKALACLLRFYNVRPEGELFVGRCFDGSSYTVRDDHAALSLFADAWSRYEAGQLTLEAMVDSLLGSAQLWGKQLTGMKGLAEMVAGLLDEMGDRE
ncbi:tagaturonate reductase [Paenibacillus sp. sptzw28]|uniref:tagaturonate reductase n=1 Tax=Paenibacillus sp. sptzw28 TaxID=715179 RepID=UPI001C6EB8A0|nr:tagaturonate reductase [Paenibacillus sp. sptzw28]QYR23268.1 tagaturonate reductase [Paenibacillus sp. sptzw28]